MKKMSIALVGLLVCFGSLVAQAQDIYMKLTPYGTGVSPTSGINQGAPTVKGDVDLSNYLQLSSIQYDFVQTLNIGSQSTGAGAGKVTFNPLTITKTVDQTSAPLFQAMASGTAYQFIEFLIVSSAGSNSQARVVLYKVLLKLAAVKTMSVSSVECTSGCPGIAESISFEYGGYVVFTYIQKADESVTPGRIAGWNRVSNVADTSPTSIIK